MPKKSAKKTISVPSIPQTEPIPLINQRKFNLFTYVIQILFWFDTVICLRPMQWFLMVAVRGYLIYQFSLHENEFYLSFTPSREETFGGILYDLFVFLPVMLFLLWYFLTTLLLFLTAIYSGFGYRTFDDENEFSEIERFKSWRDNKMRFSSYGESAQLLRDSAILNNLDNNDPESRKVLKFINNKLKFMSYEEGVEFLRGKK